MKIKLLSTIIIIIILGCTNKENRMLEAINNSNHQLIEKMIAEGFIFDDDKYLIEAISKLDKITINYVTSDLDIFKLNYETLKFLTDNKSTDIIKLLLKNGLDIKNHDSIEILKWAIDDKQIEIINSCFELGINSEMNISDQSIIDYLYNKLDITSLNHLLENKEIREIKDKNGSNIITKAIIDNKEELIKNYISKDYDLKDIKNNDYDTWEIISLYWNDDNKIISYIDIAQEVLNRGIRLSFLKETNTLKNAYESENINLIKLLIKNGMSSKVIDDAGKTLFESIDTKSASKDQKEIIKYIEDISIIYEKSNNNFHINYWRFDIYLRLFRNQNRIIVEETRENYFKSYSLSYKFQNDKLIIYNDDLDDIKYLIQINEDKWTLYDEYNKSLGIIKTITSEVKDKNILYSENIIDLFSNKWVIKEWGWDPEDFELIYITFNKIDRTVNIIYYDEEEKKYKSGEYIYSIIYDNNTIAVAYKNIFSPGYIFNYKNSKWSMHTISSLNYGDLEVTETLPGL